MKIATFNINNIRRRLSNLLDWLESSRPDIVCLQELKCTDDEFPAAEIENAGYWPVWRGQKTWNGVAPSSRSSMGKAATGGPHGNAQPTSAGKCLWDRHRQEHLPRLGLDPAGEPIQKASFRRETLLQFFARAEPTLVGMEACPGSQ